jgi:hypothetical protein
LTALCVPLLADDAAGAATWPNAPLEPGRTEGVRGGFELDECGGGTLSTAAGGGGRKVTGKTDGLGPLARASRSCGDETVGRPSSSRLGCVARASASAAARMASGRSGVINVVEGGTLAASSGA